MRVYKQLTHSHCTAETNTALESSYTPVKKISQWEEVKNQETPRVFRVPRCVCDEVGWVCVYMCSHASMYFSGVQQDA